MFRTHLLPLGLPLLTLVVCIAFYRQSSSHFGPPFVSESTTPEVLREDSAKRSISYPPPTGGLLCSEKPELAESLLRQGHRLGLQVRQGKPEMPGKDATYRAEYGRLGIIILKQRPMSAEVRCMLISHEFIHVLQHLNGDLKGVEPLGWSATPEEIKRFGEVQEAEAYRYQNFAGHVLQLLQQQNP